MSPDAKFPKYFFLANLKYKKGHSYGKIDEKIVIIKLDLDIHKIHIIKLRYS